MRQWFSLLMVCLSLCLWAQAKDIKVKQAREKAIKYALDSTLVALVEQLQEEKESAYDLLLLERLKTTHNKELKIAIFRLFTANKNTQAKDIALKFLQEEANSTRLSVVSDALDYLVCLMPEDPQVKEFLWDVIANCAQADRSRLVIIALQFWAKLEDKSKDSALIELYKDEEYPNEPKNTIIWLLGELKEEQALDLVKAISANDSEDSYRRATAIRAQARIEGEKAIDQLIPYLNDPNAQIRLAVVESMAYFNSTEAWKIVEESLRDNDVNLRLKTIYSLGLNKNEKAVEALSYKVEHEDNESVQKAALSALIKINNSQAQQFLGEVLVSSKYHESMRLQALNALLKENSANLGALLIKAVEKENLTYPSPFVLALAGRMSVEKDAQVHASSSNKAGITDTAFYLSQPFEYQDPDGKLGMHVIFNKILFDKETGKFLASYGCAIDMSIWTDSLLKSMANMRAAIICDAKGRVLFTRFTTQEQVLEDIKPLKENLFLKIVNQLDTKSLIEGANSLLTIVKERTCTNKISNIKLNSSSFEGKLIKVEGEVISSLNVMGGLFQLYDACSDETVWVKLGEGQKLPKERTFVSVKGTPNANFKILNQNYGLVILSHSIVNLTDLSPYHNLPKADVYKLRETAID
ncbi:UNVERIFIED_CONTAM: hypothetical protein PYX00_011911 [Menopon gallinae]|uniref:Uncharacterized protein n=1 Tax=Menopon gallinae TaxID=328185 RepID=A0AAW2H918_9NEOP